MLQGVPHCQYCTHKLTLPACHHCGDTVTTTSLFQSTWNQLADNLLRSRTCPCASVSRSGTGVACSACSARSPSNMKPAMTNTACRSVPLALSRTCLPPHTTPTRHTTHAHAHDLQTHSGFKNRAARFYCSGCGKSIHGEIFVAMNKVCTSACPHVNTWLARGGNELTPAGSSHATPWEQNWHEGCFACTVCRVPFEHSFYAGPDGRPYCSLHIRPSRSITS
jgi:hypothetical protein